MPSIEVLLEGERRGLLDEDQKNILGEARRRGLAPGGEPAKPAAPTMNFDPMAMLTAPISGIANIPSAAYNMIANPLQAYKDLTIGSEAQQPKTLAEADKFYNNRAVMPRVVGTAEGLASGAAMGVPERFLPETTNPDRLAARGLGSAIGATLSGGAAYKKLGELGFGGLVKNLGLPAFMGGAEPLSRLDIPGAIEGATTGAGLGGIAKGAADVAGSGLNYVGNVRPLRQQAAKAGGAAGVMKGIINPQTEAVVPNKLIGFPGETTEPISVQRGGAILGETKRIANEATTQEASAMHADMMRAAPKEPISHPIAEVFSNLVAETDPAVQSAAMKKVAAIGNNLEGKATYRASDFAGLGEVAQAQIAAEMGNLSSGNVTFENLVKTYQNLNRINTGKDLAAGRIVGIAKDIVKNGIDKFDKTAPDAVAGWYKFRDFYANEFGARFGENTPMGKLTKEEYSRFLKPDEMRMNDMGAMEPSEIKNVYDTMGKAPRGNEAVDAVQAAHLQRFKELITDQEGNPSAKQLVLQIAAEPKDSAVTRQWQALLGPRRFAGMKLMADTLRDAGYTGVNPEGRGVLGPMEAFHVLRGGLQAAGGNPLGASYHFITAGIMRLSPSLFDKMVSNRVGARLLAEGLMEKPGTPAGDRLTGRIEKVAADLGHPIDLNKEAWTDITPRADMVKNAGPIYQGPPPAPAELPSPRIGLPAPPGSIVPPSVPMTSIPEAVRAPAYRSAQVYKNTPLTPAMEKAVAKVQKAEQDALKTTPGTAENYAALKRQYAALQGLGQRYPEMDMATEGILSKFQDGTVPNAVERQYLQALVADDKSTFNVKDAAAMALRNKPPAEVQYNLAPAPVNGAAAVPPAVAPVAPVAEVHPADAIRARNAANAALRKGPKTPEPGMQDPFTVMNEMTAKEKIFVPTSALEALKKSHIKGKVSDWFTDEQYGSQDISNIIDHFHETWGTPADYNSWMAEVEKAVQLHEAKVEAHPKPVQRRRNLDKIKKIKLPTGAPK